MGPPCGALLVWQHVAGVRDRYVGPSGVARRSTCSALPRGLLRDRPAVLRCWAGTSCFHFKKKILFCFVPGECKSFKEKFMKCLRDNNFENALCRNESKEYLECRMERQLMAQEPLEKLGFGDLIDGKSDKN
ncbi:PREDICTED: uncharacterized protein LOC105002423 [Bison bison bison]|uniref:Cytochrome c oxidase assembly protein COX19 n=1 Tax=Bison bison bison TaxID=43346 RepID=A0A6P3J110_BISBB|nr:PREDICTED: uncharacterized protein LOC105002423 [Bison bison bison]